MAFSPTATIALNDTVHRRLSGVSLAAGPLLTGVSTFFWEDGKYGATGGTLLALAIVPWIHGLFSVFAALRPRMPRYSTFGLLVMLYGALGGAAFGYRDFFEAVFHVTSNDASLDALAEYSMQANLLLFWAGPLFPLSMIVLAAVLMRTRLVPIWAGAILLAGGLGFPLSRIPRDPWIAHLVDVLLLIPFAYLGWRLWRGDLRSEPRRG